MDSCGILIRIIIWWIHGTNKRDYLSEACEPGLVTYETVYNDHFGDTVISGEDKILDNLNQAGFITTNINNDFNKDGSVNEEDFLIQLQNEFDEMIESVRIYGGFYIGRYETGKNDEEAVVQKGNTDIENQTWYT